MNFSRIVYYNVRDSRRRIFKTNQKYFCTTTGSGTGKTITSFQSNPAPPSTSSTVPNVQGLSEAVIKPTSDKILPGTSKSGQYKNPEYFCYDKNSYFEAEIEMAKYRCPQPSAARK